MDESTRRLDAWRVAFRPWLDAIQTAEIQLPSPTDIDDGETVTLNIPECRQNTPTGWSLFFEAIELLDLLARVDVRLAWLLLLEVVDHRLMQYEDFPYWLADKFPRFRLDLYDSDAEQTLWSILVNVLDPILLNVRSLSPEYARAKQAVVEEWSRTHGGGVFDHHEQGQVKLKLRINLDLTQDVPVLLSSTNVEGAGEDPTQLHDSDSNESPFELESYEVRLFGTRLRRPVNSEAVSTFRYLTLDDVLKSYLSEELAARYLAKRPRGGWSGVCSVLMDTKRIARGSIRETFLGIALTPRIRKVEIEWSPEAVRDAADAQSWWSWLACAFFSHAFDHNVDTLSLPVGKLRLSEVAVMRRILSHQDPLTLLTSEDGHGAPLTTMKRPRLTPDEATASRTAHPVRHLSLADIDDEEESIQATVEFLRLIGGPLESLSIKSKFNRVVAREFLTELLVSCPNLRRVELNSVHLRSMDWLINSPQLLHREALCIHIDDETVEHQVAWPHLFDTLSDRSHPLTHSLRRLVLASPYSYTTVAVLDVIYKQCLAMLSKNDRLQYCQVECCNVGLRTRYKDRFRSFHGSLLAEVVQTRLAFCSVASAEVSGAIPSALHRLTTENVQSILAFAVKTRCRVCFID